MIRWFILAILLCLLSAPARAQLGPVSTQHTPTGTLEGSHVFTGSKVYSLSVTWHTQGVRWLMIFDGSSVPATGALPANANLLACQFMQGAGGQTDGSQNFSWISSPLLAFTGVVAVVSTNTAGCSTLTPDGASDWFAGQVQ
jgi:hypothetical protein